MDPRRIAACLRGVVFALALLPAAAQSEIGDAAITSPDLERQSLPGLYLSARIADTDGDYARAAAFYRSAYEVDPDNMFLLERAVVLSATAGEFAAALPLAETLAERAPESGAANLILAVDRIHAKDYAAAKEQIEATTPGLLADLTSVLLLAWVDFGRGEVDSALKRLSDLKGEPWYEPFKLLHTGYIAMAAGRTADAVKALETAHTADTNAVRIVEAYAVALALSDRRAEAAKVLEDYIERFPENRLASARLAELRAGKVLTSSVADPVAGAAEALGGIGAAIGQEGGQEISALYIRLALHLDPQNSGGLTALTLGNLLDASGQGDAAIAVLESIGEDQPFRALGLLRAAISLDRLERTEEAEKAFRASIENNPDDVQAYVSFANMLRGRERFPEAAEIYSTAIDLTGTPEKNDWTLFYFRGIAYEQTKQWDKAEADFKKALELYPDQPLVLNYLGYSWVDQGQNLQEALEMIRKAVELRPTDGYIVDSLGWAYYRLGRYDEAVTELEKAVELRPNDPVINDHLGDAYWKVGRPLEAQFQWRHARDFGAEAPALETILKKIAEGKLVEEGPGTEQKAELDPA